ASFGVDPAMSGSEVPSPVTIDGRRVLVVDDNATNRSIFMNLLNRWRARAEAVESGAAALRALEQAAAAGNSFELILLDLQMPGMDGLTLARRISEDPRFDGRMILLTSAARNGDATRSR